MKTLRMVTADHVLWSGQSNDIVVSPTNHGSDLPGLRAEILITGCDI